MKHIDMIPSIISDCSLSSLQNFAIQINGSNIIFLFIKLKLLNPQLYLLNNNFFTIYWKFNLYFCTTLNLDLNI